MMKRSDKVFLGIAVLGLIAVCGFGALYGLTTQRRNAAREQMLDTESLALHRALAAESAEAPAEAGGEPQALAQSPRERIAAFDRLFEATAFTNNDPEWGELVGDPGKVPAELSDETLESLRGLVKAIEPQLDTIRALAAQDGPVEALDFSKGHALELPHLAPLRHTARLLLADAVVAREAGDIARVTADLEAVYGLANALEGEPVLISQLVRVAIASIGYNGLRLLPETGLDAAHYERVSAILAASDHREAFASGFAGEAAMMKVFFDDPEQMMHTTIPADPIEAGLVRLYASALGAPLRHSDEATALEILGQIQALGTLPLYEARLQLEAVEAEIDDLGWLQPVSAIMLPSLSRAVEAQARHEAMLDLAQMGLAIEQFRDDAGSYPASLEEVSGYVAGGAPLDPFTGAPYVYRASEDSFLLYSVGRDLDDDGGMHDLDDADIVWRGVEAEQP